jgi:hypothetical protein
MVFLCPSLFLRRQQFAAPTQQVCEFSLRSRMWIETLGVHDSLVR